MKLNLNGLIFCNQGYISKVPNFDVFLFWNVKNVKVDLMANIKWQHEAQNCT